MFKIKLIASSYISMSILLPSIGLCLISYFQLIDPLFNVFIFPIENQIVQHVTIPVTPKIVLQFTKNWFGCYNILTWLIIKLS
jgi:hypothetical protein